eukprot:5740057-Pyramimonas_sp.AAC.1
MLLLPYPPLLARRVPPPERPGCPACARQSPGLNEIQSESSRRSRLSKQKRGRRLSARLVYFCWPFLHFC